MVIMTDNGLES